MPRAPRSSRPASSSASPRRALVRRDAVEGSKQRIHGAALRLFARYGYEGVSLQQIADEVGLHKSSLFHHYAGKRELAAEVFLRALDRVLEILDPLGDETGGDAEAVFPVLDRLVDHFSDAPEEARLLMALIIAPEDTELHEVFGGREPAAVGELYARLARWLERARSSGRIRRVPIRQTLFNLIAVALFYPAAIGSQQLVDGPVLGSDPFSERARRIRKQELRILVRGVLARPD